MLLGVISDTHGHVHNARAGVRMLESFGVQAVLHCGDVGSTAIVPLFAAWPTRFVYGNCDHGQALQLMIDDAGQTCHGRFDSFELDEVKIALLHGDDDRLLRCTIAEGKHQLVCHGHTHVPRNERIGSTWVVNPGALYRADPHTIAIVDLKALTAEIVTV
ncbi:MAG: metallophosphoesterase family protein [Pirellulales bacterium]|nr:metallophosphoesterase family protein [Pirellulales bacterium]